MRSTYPIPTPALPLKGRENHSPPFKGGVGGGMGLQKKEA